MIDTIGMTDIGNGRPSNQDAYLLRQKEKNGKLYLLAVVCDGMGCLLYTSIKEYWHAPRQENCGVTTIQIEDGVCHVLKESEIFYNKDGE